MTHARTTSPSIPAPPAPSSAPSSGVQLRSSLVGQSFSDQVQMLAPRESKANNIQREARAGVSGGGGSLPHAEAIQRSFGRHDVSNVQAYSGGQAAAATEAMGAKAYASGNKVALGDGGSDLHTVAHEAAHVVQQRAGVSLDGGVGKSGDRHEQHAEAVAAQVVQGKSAEGLLDQYSGGGATSDSVQGFLGFGEDDEEEDEDSGGGGGGGGVGGAIANAWGGAKEAVGGAIDGAKEAVGGAIDGAKEAVGGAIGGAKEAVGGAVDTVKGVASEAWDGVREAGGEAWDTVKQAGGDAAALMRKYGAKTMEELQGILAKLPGGLLNENKAEAPPTLVGHSGKVTFPLHDIPLGTFPCGELSLSFAVEIAYKVVADPQGARGWKFLWGKSDGPPEEEGGGGKTEATGGANIDPGSAGIQGEVKRELAEKFLGAKVSQKGGAEVGATGKGNKAKVSVGGELEWEFGGTSFTSGFDYSILKMEGGGKMKFGVITRSCIIKPFTGSHVMESGETLTIEVSGKAECDLDLNELWLAQQLANGAVTLGAVPLALIVGGLLSVGIPLVQIANMENVEEGVGSAKKVIADVRRYGTDFVNGLKGSYAPTQGGLEAAKWLDKLEATEGPAAVAKFINEMNPASAYTQAVGQAWPQIKQRAMDAYYKAHPYETVGGLIDYGGAAYLKKIMNDEEPSVMKYSS